MTGKTTRTVLLALVLAIGGWSIALQAQSVPLRINFQGRLTDTGNQPITAATAVVISLYRGGSAQDAPGVLLYRESASIQPDSSGVFSHLIGTGSALDGTALESADFNTPETVYLEVSIGGAAQLPRQQVVSVPYAIQAGTLGGFTAADFLSATGGQISVERARLTNPAASDGIQVTMTNATNASAAASLVNLSSSTASRGLAVTSAGGRGVTVSSQSNNALQASSTGSTAEASTVDAANSSATTGTAVRARMTGASNIGTALLVENNSASGNATGAAINTQAGTALRLQSSVGSAAVIAGSPVLAGGSLVDVDAGGAQASSALAVRNSNTANSGAALRVNNLSASAAARGARVETAAGNGVEIIATTGSALTASNNSGGSPTILATQAGTSSQPALLAQATALNSGPAGSFTNVATSPSASAVYGELTGVNNAGTTARFLNLSANTAGRALFVESGAGDGMELRSSSGNNAAELKNNSSGVVATLLLQNTGSGDLIRAIAGGTFDMPSNGILRFRVQNDGVVTASAFNMPAADFAEMMAVCGALAGYAAGDVLVISAAGDLMVEKSTGPYARSVAGVYSTKPGVLGHHPMLTASGSKVPVAVVGIVPCKVTAENGPITQGDLLVTSSTAGHAMRGTDPSRMLGAVVGKALQPHASGAGVIQVLVSLQ